MDASYSDVVLRLALALLVGGVIGFERTYHGRPAGFRTHILVCTASTLLMLLTAHQWELLPGAPLETIRVDPTRMAQGIMTGIGFLGAGVIIKERLGVRGLTTAASIWMTASIGIVIGMGFHGAATLAAALTLGTLVVFRWLEDVVPTLRYARLSLVLEPGERLGREELCRLLAEHGVRCGPAVAYLRSATRLQYQLTVRTRDPDSFERLSVALSRDPRIRSFSLQPAGD